MAFTTQQQSDPLYQYVHNPATADAPDASLLLAFEEYLLAQHVAYSVFPYGSTESDWVTFLGQNNAPDLVVSSLRQAFRSLAVATPTAVAAPVGSPAILPITRAS